MIVHTKLWLIFQNAGILRTVYEYHRIGLNASDSLANSAYIIRPLPSMYKLVLTFKHSENVAIACRSCRIQLLAVTMGPVGTGLRFTLGQGRIRVKVHWWSPTRGIRRTCAYPQCTCKLKTHQELPGPSLKQRTWADLQCTLGLFSLQQPMC